MNLTIAATSKEANFVNKSLIQLSRVAGELFNFEATENKNRFKNRAMEKQNEIKIFEDKKVRTLWDAENEKWYFSIVDVVDVLTEQPSYQGARNY